MDLSKADIADIRKYVSDHRDAICEIVPAKDGVRTQERDFAGIDLQTTVFLAFCASYAATIKDVVSVAELINNLVKLFGIVNGRGGAPDEGKEFQLRERILVLLLDAHVNKSGMTEAEIHTRAGGTRKNIVSALESLLDGEVIRKTKGGIWKYKTPSK